MSISQQPSTSSKQAAPTGGSAPSMQSTTGTSPMVNSSLSTAGTTAPPQSSQSAQYPVKKAGTLTWVFLTPLGRIGILLLVIFVLGALGSTTIFAGGNRGSQQVPTPTSSIQATPSVRGAFAPTPAPTPRGTPTPAPTPRGTPTPASTPRVTPTPTPTSRVTPTPAPTPTQASSSIAGQPGNLPDAWINSGRGNIEFYQAGSVAETFTASYETLDWRSTQSFDSATFSMTPAALNRFRREDVRVSWTFIDNFYDQQKVSVAHVHSSHTRILQAFQGAHHFFAWFQVDYSETHQQINRAPFTDSHSLVVLLMAVPVDGYGTNSAIRWEVSQWCSSKVVFPIPSPAEGGP